jgi:translation initiation factor IF-2
MSDERPSDVLSALPRTRPHRRSGKRAERSVDTPASAAEPAAGEAKPAARAAKPAAGAAKPQAEKLKAAAAKPKAAKPPARKPTSTKPTAAKPTARKPSTAKPSTAKPTAARPTAATPAARKPRAGTGAGTRAKTPYQGERLRQPPQPAGTPSRQRSRKPVPASGTEILGTAVQAAAELAEIGLSVSARALRNAVSRLPKP